MTVVFVPIVNGTVDALIKYPVELGPSVTGLEPLFRRFVGGVFVSVTSMNAVARFCDKLLS